MSTLLNRLAGDTQVYPHRLNLLNDSVLLVQLNDAELSGHSFLDERLFRQDMGFEWVAWAQFEAHAAALADEAPSYIFHIGHCGSTLLSRLVAAATGTQALREPLPLRAFALDRSDGRAGMLGDDELRRRIGLFERVWARGAVPATVKATSVCTTVMDLVNDASRRVFLCQRAETHLAVILAGENALQDLRGFGQSRYRRLAEFAPDLPRLSGLSSGELAAMTWLAEVASASRALASRPALKLDFDCFLRQPVQALAEACAALGLSTTSEACAAAVNGPIMRTYAKAPEHAYGPRLRDDIIKQSRSENAAEIARGMALIERFRSTTCGAGWR